MNKEILKWINKNIKYKVDELKSIKRCKGPICQNPDPLKEDVIILGQIKKELEEKDKMEKLMPKPILDDVELRYLKNVIRPFKDKVEYVRKIQSATDWKMSYIYIDLKEDGYIMLPKFVKKTMYKKMILEKKYTLDELGIKY